MGVVLAGPCATFPGALLLMPPHSCRGAPHACRRAHLLPHRFPGKWTPEQIKIVDDFTGGLHTSKWWNTMKHYYYQADAKSSKIYVSDNLALAKSVVDNYSKGTSISGNDIPDIIQALISSGKLPEDGNAVYVFLSSGDVREKIRSDLGNAAFCQAYCGYHVSWELKSKTRIFYAMVGVPSSCMSGCAGPASRSGPTPNGDAPVDAMLSALAHEIVEAVSDPVSDINEERAWEDGSHAENGDLCAYKVSVKGGGVCHNVVTPLRGARMG
jgi:hypothetical protein